MIVGSIGGAAVGSLLAKIVQNRGWNPYILAAAVAGSGALCGMGVQKWLGDNYGNNEQSAVDLSPVHLSALPNAEEISREINNSRGDVAAIRAFVIHKLPSGFQSDDQRLRTQLIGRAFTKEQIEAIVSGTLDDQTRNVLEGKTFEQWYSWLQQFWFTIPDDQKEEKLGDIKKEMFDWLKGSIDFLTGLSLDKSASHNDFEIILGLVESQPGKDNKEKFINAIKKLTLFRCDRLRFIELMQPSINNNEDIAQYRSEAVSQLKNALTEKQKRLIKRAYKKEQIQDIISDNKQYMDNVLYELKPANLEAWLVWASQYCKTVESASWLALVKNDFIETKETWFKDAPDVYDFIMTLEGPAVLNRIITKKGFEFKSNDFFQSVRLAAPAVRYAAQAQAEARENATLLFLLGNESNTAVGHRSSLLLEDNTVDEKKSFSAR